MGSFPRSFVWLLFAALVILTCSDSDKSVEPPVDNTVPAQISDLTVDFNDEHSVLLNWSAVGDDGNEGAVSTYEVCWSEDYDLVLSMDSAAHLVGHELSGAPGELLSLEVMVGDTQLLLYFSVRAIDEAGNRGEVSNVAVLNSAYLGRPDPIDDLHAECLLSNSMKLVWTTPPIENDDAPAVSYDIRVSQSEINEDNFLDAELVPNIPQPIQVGETEELVVENLTEGNTYYFGIRAIGYNEEFYSYSNFISANCNDETAPATIDDFVIVYVNSTDITLGWTAVGDDDSIGTAAFYELRVSADSITEANWSEATIISGLSAPKAAGEIERFDVPYDAADTTLCFGLSVHDEAGNVSGLAITKFIREPEPEHIIWSQYYDVGGDENATCATEVVDGFVIAGTTISETSMGVDIFVVKTDLDGNPQWSRVYGGAGDECPVGVSVKSSGNLVIGGHSSSTIDGDRDPYFLEISSGGDFIGEAYDHYPGDETIVDFAKTSDGGYVLVGSSTSSTDSTSSSYTHSFMAKYSSSYAREYYSLITGWSACDDYTGYANGVTVAASPDGYFIQGYHVRHYEPWGHTMCGPEIDAASFRFISNDGPILESYYVGGSFFDSGFMDWLLTSDHSSGTIAIYNIYLYSGYYICKVDEQFKIVSDNPLTFPENGSLKDAIWRSAGVLIAESIVGDKKIVKFAEDGTYMATLDIDSQLPLELISLEPASSDRVVLTGTTKPGTTGWDAYVALIDPNF